MADLRYSIEVNTKNAISSVNELKNALGALASAFAIRELTLFSDQITSLRNRLLTLTPSIESVNKQFDALAAIAISARTPLAATADLYYRIARAADALGISQKEAAQITESVAKALTASGQSGAEAAGPLLQLGQALQSGTFQGDELRSILEGLPPVAQALADELGVPVGQLKKLGSEGQISADVFVAAMRRAKDSIDEAFGRTTPTISQALTNLRTNASILFNEFEKNTETGRNVALAIEYLGFQLFKLSKNIDDIIRPLTTLIQIVGSLIVFTVVGRAFAALGAAITGIVRGMSAMGARFSNIKDVVLNFKEALAAVGKNFTGFSELVIFITAPFAKLVALIAAGAAALYAWSGIGDIIDKIKSLGQAGTDGQKELEAYRKELEKMKQGLDDTAKPGENAAAAAKKLAEELAKATLAMKQQVENVDLGLETTRRRLSLENEILRANQDGVRISQGDAEVRKTALDIDIERKSAIKQITDQMATLNLEYSQLVKKDSQRGKEIQQQLGVLKQQEILTAGVYNKHEGGMAALLRANQNLKMIEEDRKRTQDNIIKAIEDQISRQDMLGKIIQDFNSKAINLRFEASQVGVTGVSKDINQAIRQIDDQARQLGQQIAETYSKFGDDMPAEASRQLAAELKIVADNSDRIKKLTLDNIIANYEYQQSIDRVTRSFNDQKAAQDLVGDTLRKINDEQKQLDFEKSLRKLSPLRQQIAKINKDAADAALQAGRALAGQFTEEDGLTPERAQQLADGLNKISQGYRGVANEQLKALGVSKDYMAGFPDIANETLKSVLAFQEEFKFGVKDAFISYRDDALDAAKQAKDGFNNFTQGLEDAFVKLALTGKLSFKDMANSILADLARIMVKRALVFAATSFFPGFFPGRAGGGPVDASKPYVVGEQGPELFVPNSAGKIIPNNKLTAGSGSGMAVGQTTVNYNIQAVDAASFRSLVARDPSFIFSVTEAGRRSQPTRSR